MLTNTTTGIMDFAKKTRSVRVNRIPESLLYDAWENEAEKKLRSFFDLSLDLICIAGTDGYFKEVSSSFGHMLGYSREELLSRPYTEFVIEKDRERTDDIGAAFKRGEPVVFHENGYLCKDGSIRYISWKASAPTEDGLVFAIGRDITAQKEDEQRFQVQMDELEMFKKEVSESLRYAAKLQKALLQDKEELKESLPGSFVMFQPKNIVSGDFYWFQNNNDKVYVSVGDCTGHGVPGALMNIMSLNMLHSTYKHEQMISPSLLLHSLDKDLHDKLSHKSTGKKMMNDSVDITICEIDKKKMILTFSGANSNVYLKRKNSVRRFKTDRYSIGTAEADKQFGTEQISIEKGDILFLLSDGFIDQFGGEKGKKFGSKRFYELLENLDAEQFENYKKIFPAVFSAWKGKEEQTDDVLVMGIRI